MIRLGQFNEQTQVYNRRSNVPDGGSWFGLSLAGSLSKAAYVPQPSPNQPRYLHNMAEPIGVCPPPTLVTKIEEPRLLVLFAWRGKR